MQKTFIYLMLLWIACSSCSRGRAEREVRPSVATAEETTGEHVPLADPFIMLYRGVYYAYGTGSDNGIPVYTSDDLKCWEKKAALALDKKDSWGDKWFWAPEVYEVNGTFYMYYSADEHICVATAASPAGPFRQQVKAPIIADEKCIDHSLFIDTDGTPYLFFCRFNDGLNVWMAELESDLTTLRSATLRPCIHTSQPWEQVWPRVNEGPFVIKHAGVYYLTYSANSYESPFYGIGCAVTTDLQGDWRKYEHNPLLQKPEGLVGTGHHCIFTDKEGRLRLAFHAHKDKNNIHPREMYITRVGFKETGAEPVLEIDSCYMTPVLKHR